MTKSILQSLAQSRMAEGSLLLANGHFSGAYYLSGYAVELAFKACVATQFQAQTVPTKSLITQFYQHDLDRLKSLAGLDPDLENRIRQDMNFEANWKRVKDWRETSRYEIIAESEARGLVQALSDPNHGVFPWIRTHW